MYNKITSVYVTENPECGGSPSFCNLDEALEYVANIRSNGALQPISVRLCDSEYTLARPIEINEKMCDITIEPNDPEASVLISAGRRICGFEKTVFNDIECFGAYIPEVKDGSWEFTDLYVDGCRADYTRYPENGVLEVEDIENHSDELGAGSSWVIAKREDMEPLLSCGFDGAIMSFCHFWIDEHTPIKSYDPETGRLEMQYRSRFTINSVHGQMPKLNYYLENVAFTFKKANQWYLDRNNGMLYYIPRSQAQTPDNIVVYAPVSSQFINIIGARDKNVCGIRLCRLEFAYTCGDYASGQNAEGDMPDTVYASDPQAVANAFGAITFKYAHACSVEDCTIRNFGLHAINITEGCDKIKISGNNIIDGGAGGVRINGAGIGGNLLDVTRDNFIDNNIIRSCGRRYMAACGVLIMNSAGNTVSHNEIADLYYTGVSCGWVWGYGENISRDNIITKNYIHHLGHGKLSDMGGVYLLGKQPGTIVSNNVIHDVISKHYGGWALYTDEGSSFITLENNICYRTSDNIYHQHYGSMNTVRNNIFAFAGNAVMRVSRYEEHVSIIFERNIIMSSGEPIYDLSVAHYENQTIGSEKNLYITTNGSLPVFIPSVAEKLEDMRKNGMDILSMVGDNCFADVKNDDFTVDMDNPAVREIGYREIDISDVGPMR